MDYLPILQRAIAGEKLTTEEQEKLLAAQDNNKAFGITAVNGADSIAKRIQLLQKVYPEVQQLCENIALKDSNQNLLTLWNLWLPLAMQLAFERKKLNRPLIQGILGGQGTGKTTLAVMIRLILKHLGYSTLDLSLDDLYKTYSERQKLQKEDPRLIWRGPPGTHDVDLGVELLDNVRRGATESLFVPRFDKSAWNGAGDRTQPEQVRQADIVLFEGWFVGARPIEESLFEAAPAPIISAQNRQFARDMNRRLQAYLPLWSRLDRLLILYPVDYRLSKQWRQEAEQKMKATGKAGMSDEEISRFVDYFWLALHPQLFIKPLIRDASLVDLVVEINADHCPGKIYQP